MDDSAVCEQQLGCYAGESQYSNEFLCEEQATNCHVVQICDTKIWCGTRTLRVDVKVRIGEDVPTYEFSNPEGFFAKSCSGAFKVSKRNGNDWIPLTDERPWRTTGPHYLDGVYEELLLDAYLGCDVVACGPIESISGAPKLLEYFQTGSMAPPVEQQELNSSIPDQIPVIESAISEPPWLFEIEYFNQEDCMGAPVVVTIEVSSFSVS